MKQMMRRRCLDYVRCYEVRHLQRQIPEDYEWGGETWQEEERALIALERRFERTLHSLTSSGDLQEREEELLDRLSHNRDLLMGAIAGEVQQRGLEALLGWNQSKVSRGLSALQAKFQEMSGVGIDV